jgi:hypothetical protein
MEESRKDFGGISVKVLEIEKSTKETEPFISQAKDLKDFISNKIGGEFKVRSRFKPPTLLDSEIKSVNSLATGKSRFDLKNRKILWKELYPLGIVEFEKIWVSRKVSIPICLKEENRYFLFEGSEIIRSFDKKVFYLSLFYQGARIFRYIHPAEETGDFKSLVVKRKK